MKKVMEMDKKLIVVFGVLAFAIALIIPNVAFAAGGPGADEGDVVGKTAETQVNLKIDENKLSFTAPTIINFTMDSEGGFITPESGVAYIKNNSVFDIQVKSYAVTSKNGAVGVADVSGATGADTYAIGIKGNTEAVTPFAINSASDWAGWKLAATGNTGDTCGLTFVNGKMVNPTAKTWHDGAALQDVIWTVSAANN